MAVEVSYEGEFNSHVFFFKFLVLGDTMSVVTAPSDPRIIRPPHDRRTEIKHCCNDNGETSEFVA